MTLHVSTLLHNAGLFVLAAPPRADNTQTFAYLVGTLATLVLVALGIWLANHLVHQRRYDSHSGLFSALCRVHKLDRRDRRLLRRLACHHRLAQPGRLFLEPDLLNPARLGPRFRASSREIVALRTSLFVGQSDGGREEADSPPTAHPR